jgi:hypothetical protein
MLVNCTSKMKVTNPPARASHLAPGFSKSLTSPGLPSRPIAPSSERVMIKARRAKMKMIENIISAFIIAYVLLAVFGPVLLFGKLL